MEYHRLDWRCLAWRTSRQPGSVSAPWDASQIEQGKPESVKRHLILEIDGWWVAY